MTGPKGFASLSGALLARKGQARPASRLADAGEPAAAAAKPVVLRQREALDAQIAAPGLAEGALARLADEVAARKPRSAFTLRLDADRHLRLRLASAITRQSAQQLVIQALDALFETLPTVETLAQRAQAGGKARVKE